MEPHRANCLRLTFAGSIAEITHWEPPIFSPYLCSAD